MCTENTQAITPTASKTEHKCSFSKGHNVQSNLSLLAHACYNLSRTFPRIVLKMVHASKQTHSFEFFYNIHPEKLCFTLHRNVFNLHQRVTLCVCVCVCTAAFVRLISPQQLYHVHPTPPTPTEAGVASVNSRNF